MLAAKFYDPVIGVDTHIVMVPSPAGPIPTPMPMPFVGMVFDPLGLAIGAAIGCATGGGPGLVMVNGMPAANCGTEVTLLLTAPHIPAPGPFMVPPGMDANLNFGALNARIGGTFGVRFGEIALSCSDPVRLPTSVVMAIPLGMPFLVLRPPCPDVMMLIMGAVFKAAFRALGAILRGLAAGGRALFRALRAVQRRSGSSWERAARRLHNAIDNLGPRFNRVRNALHDAACFVTGHPVDVATGRLFTEVVDLELPGPLPLRFERRYDSNRSGRAGVLGYGWSHTYEQKIWAERGALVLWDSDGREIELSTMHLPGRMLAVGGVVEDLGNSIAIRRASEHEYVVRQRSGETRRFRYLGNVNPETRAPIFDLVEIRSSNGAHTIEVHHDREGRLTHLRDSCGRLVELAYDVRGRLAWLNAPVRYGERGFMRHRRYEYDIHGDLVQVTDPAGASYRYEYEAHLLVREQDRAGLSFYFEYDGRTPMARCVRTWGDGGIYDHVIHYDRGNKKTIVENSCGETTVYTLDERNMVVEVMDPHGAKTKYAYDERFNRPSKTIRADETAVETEFDPRGNVVALTGPDGSTFRLAYDGADRAVELVDAVGGVTRLVYDTAGNLALTVGADGATTRYQWTDGLLSSVTSAEGRWVHYGYESKQVSQVSTPSGLLVEHWYDGRGDVEKSRTARGGVTRMRRDAEGRVLETESLAGTTSVMRYDAEGNLLEVADPTRRIGLAYGHYHRVVSRTEAGTTLRFEYDTEDRLVGVRNEADERYGFELDACGRVRVETGFDGRSRRYERDAMGRVTKQLSAELAETKLAYDAAGRLLAIEHEDGTKTELGYRADGLLVRAVNETSVVELERDVVGRVVRETIDGISVESHFGADGMRHSARTSLGASWWMQYDGLGEVATIGLGQVRHSRPADEIRFERDGLGLELARELPSGVRVAWERDVAGRPLARRTFRTSGPHGATMAAGAPFGARMEVGTVGYRWRGEDQIAALVDSQRGPTQYEHDARGRLIRERRVDAVVERAMDAVGNVYRTADGRDRRYGAGGRLEQANGTRYEHDEDGNLVRRTEADGRTWHYRWNGSGMLREVERPDGSRVRFGYDAFARRTKKQVVRLDADGNATLERETRFAWDGHVVAHELDSLEGRTDWFWEPGTFTPVAKEHAGRRWTIASDHLGTPTEMYDELGELAWKMQLDVFGVPRFEKGTAEDCPWRWPGQYEDGETGLYYNRWRYYDGARGEYIFKDPLGLLGSFALYSYTQDPTLTIDPFGLDGHHTVPVALVDQMRSRGWSSMGSDLWSSFTRTSGGGLASLPGGSGGSPHLTAHQALSDFLNGQYPGLSIRNGYQHRADWSNYLNRAGGSAQVFADMDRFYNQWLPDQVANGRYPSLNGYVDDMRYAYDVDQRVLRGTCP